MTLIITLLVGLAAGFLGGLLGIGGGVVMIPGMTMILGVPQHVAQGASLAAITAISVAGAITHSQHGYVDFKVALVMAPAAVIFTWLGAWLANRLDAYLLTKLFALLPLYFGTRLALGK